MELQQKKIKRRLLGYFMVEGHSMLTCRIVDWKYLEEYLLRNPDEECQIISYIDSETLKTKLPQQFYKQGYIRVGVDPSFELSLQERVEQQFPKYIDIPVYGIYQDDGQFSVSVELNEWVTSYKVWDSEDEQSERNVAFSKDRVCYLSTSEKLLTRKLIGYVTGIWGEIIICETEFVDICNEYKTPSDSTQVTVPSLDENVPGFRGAVIINLPEDLRDREFPVFGEYERNTLKRIIIEIADSTKGKKVWDYNFVR